MAFFLSFHAYDKRLCLLQAAWDGFLGYECASVIKLGSGSEHYWSEASLRLTFNLN